MTTTGSSLPSPPIPSPPPLRIGMLGYAFMGRVHSQAFRTAPAFFDLPREIDQRLLVGRDGDRVARAAADLGWHEHSTRWQDLIERDDIDVVDIASPGDTHAEVAIAALAAGKHVLCEKPLANTVEQAEAMTRAAAEAAKRGVVAMVGFTYRRVPAITLARDLVAAGRIGQVRQVRARYLQDWLADPAAGWTWRLDREAAGSGALGDIGAHIVDAVQFITGHDVVGVTGLAETFVAERTDAAGALRPVTVDDAAVFVGRLANGATASFEASRFAWGRKNAIQLEINGTTGSIAFDLEDLNVLHLYDASAGDLAGFTRVVVTEATHPYLAAWWPPGHMLGYEHAFTHQVADLVTAVAQGSATHPTFTEGLQVQRVLEAVLASSAAGGSWREVAPSSMLASSSSSPSPAVSPVPDPTLTRS